MDELLTVDEYRALTGKTISWLAVQGASGIVRDYCGWQISAFSDAVEQLDSDGGTALFLPALKVTDVSAVVARGTDRWGIAYPQPLPSEWDWHADGRVVWTGLWPNGWQTGPRRYAVTFSGGYDDIPPAVKMVVLSIAERIAAPSAVHQKLSNVGGIQTNTTYSTNTDSNGMTDLEEAVLSPYRIWQTR